MGQNKKTMDKYTQMTQLPLGRLILSLGIPTTITMLITNVYNLVDTYFVGRLGKSASGAIGIVFGLMAILQAISFMLGQGAGINISRKLGEKNQTKANEFASTSFFISLGVGILFTCLGLIFIDPLMRLLGSTDTILPYSRVYGSYILLAAPAIMSSFIMNLVFRYEGRAAIGMIGITIGGVLNMILDPILMFGFDMGIAGAGLSTAISQYISFFVLYTMFRKKMSQCVISRKNFTKEIKDIVLIMYTGLPSMVRQGLSSISTMLLNLCAKPYGDGAIAAMSIVSRCCMLLFAVGLGIGQGFQPVAGFNYGAGKFNRVKKGFGFTLLAGTTILGLCATVGLIFSHNIVGIFCDDPEVIPLGTYALRAQFLALYVLPVSVCGNMLYQSTGHSAAAAVLSTFRSGLFFIPLILILPLAFGAHGIALAQPVADVIATLATIPFIIRFFQNLPEDTKQ